MPDSERDSRWALDEEAALRSVVEGTATETGERFFAALVEALARALGTHGAWVTEYHEPSRRLRALAFRMGDEWIDDFEYDIAGTPCELVIQNRRLVHYADNVVELFPDDADLVRFHAVSFMGVPLVDPGGRVLGHLAVLDTRPLPQDPRCLALMRIFAARAAAELRRLAAEAETGRRERQLSRLVESAMDAILELDQELRVTLANPAAERIFRAPATDLVGRALGELVAAESRIEPALLARDLDRERDGATSIWIPSGLAARRPDGATFPAEATLSRSVRGAHPHYTLILRNLQDRLEAEGRIDALTREREYLRDEIRALTRFDELVGESAALRAVLREVEQVAPTDATVLVLGETGTGKELIARAVHAASARRERALVTVNCAAVPASLMESEFFGHEKGAFTGATSRREGRFALAHQGTLFLDEIGDLPLDLQAKLLRVLQEGEFEPVGSARTVRVDVRLIAATNRDLARAVREGGFREDLYYRLNVFPVRLPPLRERAGDVARLAAAFAERAARRLGRTLAPLAPDQLARLEAYDWPGNVRELQNVIERAVITSTDSRLNLDRALPETAGAGASRAVTPPAAGEGARILTAEEMAAVARANVLRALDACGWKVAGADGAARRLGLSPSTLSSRMKSLGIRRPRERG